MNSIDLQNLLERCASLLRSETRSQLNQYGLQPVQFEALRYLGRCNRYSDTPMAVTEYLGQTKGTVSQTLKVLEKKGLIYKEADSEDKRKSHLKLSQQGHQILQSMLPGNFIEATCHQLGEENTQFLAERLKGLLGAMQEANQQKSFGQCKTCHHHLTLTSGQLFCDLTQEELTQPDGELICREHQY